jgi:hypothetical protein
VNEYVHNIAPTVTKDLRAHFWAVSLETEFILKPSMGGTSSDGYISYTVVPTPGPVRTLVKFGTLVLGRVSMHRVVVFKPALVFLNQMEGVTTNRPPILTVVH